MSRNSSVLIIDDDRVEGDRLVNESAISTSQNHVLVIDDEPDMLGLYQACFTGHGYRVTAASDGMAGLDIAHVDRPALIILDMLMPGMGGMEVCERLRSDSRTEEIPILMVSGRDDVNDRIQSLRKGVDDFISKPFEYEELVARAEALIRRSTVRSRADAAPLSPEDRRRIQILRIALRDGPDSLVPRYDVRALSGYAYPAAGEVTENDENRDPISDLEFLHANAYLERTFFDVVLSCPFCTHHDIHLREVCPACGSADLMPVEMIHHYRCAFVGPSEAFRQNGKLVCPKCRVQLRHIGLEYEKPTDTVQCGGCDRGFQEPDVGARCRNCDRPFPPEQAERKRIYAYGLTAAGRFAAEMGSFQTSPGGPDFTEEETEVYRPEFFREIVSHEVARGTTLGHPTALLRVGVRGIEKILSTRGRTAGQRALHEVVRNIRSVTRRVDKIGRMLPSEFVVLIPGADTRAAVSLGRRIAESFNQTREESLEMVGLSYAWAVHPTEAEDAQMLLSRVMEEMPTAHLGEPEAYEKAPDPAGGGETDRPELPLGLEESETWLAQESGGKEGVMPESGPSLEEDREDREVDEEFNELIAPDKEFGLNNDIGRELDESLSMLDELVSEPVDDLELEMEGGNLLDPVDPASGPGPAEHGEHGEDVEHRGTLPSPGPDEIDSIFDQLDPEGGQ